MTRVMRSRILTRFLVQSESGVVGRNALKLAAAIQSANRAPEPAGPSGRTCCCTRRRFELPTPASSGGFRSLPWYVCGSDDEVGRIYACIRECIGAWIAGRHAVDANQPHIAPPSWIPMAPQPGFSMGPPRNSPCAPASDCGWLRSIRSHAVPALLLAEPVSARTGGARTGSSRHHIETCTCRS